MSSTEKGDLGRGGSSNTSSRPEQPLSEEHVYVNSHPTQPFSQPRGKHSGLAHAWETAQEVRVHNTMDDHYVKDGEDDYTEVLADVKGRQEGARVSPVAAYEYVDTQASRQWPHLEPCRKPTTNVAGCSSPPLVIGAPSVGQCPMTDNTETHTALNCNQAQNGDAVVVSRGRPDCDVSDADGCWGRLSVTTEQGGSYSGLSRDVIYDDAETVRCGGSPSPEEPLHERYRAAIPSQSSLYMADNDIYNT